MFDVGEVMFESCSITDIRWPMTEIKIGTLSSERSPPISEGFFLISFYQSAEPGQRSSANEHRSSAIVFATDRSSRRSHCMNCWPGICWRFHSFEGEEEMTVIAGVGVGFLFCVDKCFQVGQGLLENGTGDK